jgi:hypothetical protein
MDMRMSVQGLSPGMQDAEEADLGSETLGVGGYFQERGTGGLEQEGKQEFLVLPHQRNQAVWNTENNVVVPDRQQLLLSFAEPLLACVDLALRAVTIPAAEKRDGLITTAKALIAMPAESSGAAPGDRIEYLALRPAQ